jgi:hypothetical protein
MNKNRKLTILIAFLGHAFIAGGMGLKDYIEYSPFIGWLGGMMFQVLALRFAIKGIDSNNEFFK